MRLVFTVTNDLSYDQRMQRICSTLADAGHEVELVGFVKKHSIPLKDQPYVQKRLRLVFRKGSLFYAEYNIRLFFLLLSSRADLFCAIDLDTLLPAWLGATLRRKHLCLDAHEFYSELPEVVTRRGVRQFWSVLERFLLPRVQSGYTVSRGIADIFKQRYHVSYKVIPNYPLKKASVEHQAHSGVLLYQGALNKGRGLEALIRASARFPHHKLLIAGEGDLSGELRSYAASVGASNIEFLGYVPPEKLRELTKNAWLGVNILDNCGLSYYHSLTNKFLDYIHAGLPQICIDFPEYRRINDKYEIAFMLPEATDDHIVQAVRKLDADPVHYERLRQNCVHAAEQLHWGVVEPDVLAFYEQFTEEKS